MKILLLGTHLDIGGVGVYTVNLARYLRKEGVDATVASAGGDYENVLAENRIPHIKLLIRTKAEFGIKIWKTLPVLTTLIRDNGFGILHAQTRVTQVLAQLAGKVAHVPFVSTCHGFFQYRRLSRKLFPCWGEKVIAISDSVRRHLLEDFHLQPDSVVRVYNGIELERYLSTSPVKDHDLMESIGLPGDATVVGAIGRLSPVKGFRYLISAFKEVASRDAKARLLIVGEGPEKEILQKQILTSGVANRILLIAGDAPLEKYLSLVDIYCVPSVNEGLGLSLMEAMAAGRACIASDVGGISELIINETNGILVPPEDSKALAAAILRLAADVRFGQQLAKNARRKAADNFSIIDSVAKTVKVYKDVIKTYEA